MPADHSPSRYQSRHIPKWALSQVRDNCNWQSLFFSLGLVREKSRRQGSQKANDQNDWWAISPLNPNEKDPSFHITPKGWYCFSTQQGGGVLELVKAVTLQREGRHINESQAALWLVENGLSSFDGMEKYLESGGGSGRKSLTIFGAGGGGEERKNEGMAKMTYQKPAGEVVAPVNPPIKQSLLYKLAVEHPEMLRRGISPATCRYLGCGFLGQGTGAINNRIVFQVRGVQEEKDGNLTPIILTHMGRATNWVQESRDGKWHIYANFHRNVELYNLDKVLLDEKARDQARQTGAVIIVEGCFDVAKLVEAGILNVVATFGAHLDQFQIPKLKLIAKTLGVNKFIVFYDRDKAGRDHQAKALSLLAETGFEGVGFNWELTFSRTGQAPRGFPENIKDACDMTVEQLRWLRGKRLM